METRELFERLVADEPALRLSPSEAARTGQRVATRRWSVAGVLAATVVVVGGGVAVRVAADDPRATAPGSSAPDTAAVDYSSLPFTSAAQITNAGNGVWAALRTALPPAEGWSATVGSRTAYEIDPVKGGLPDRVLGLVHHDGPAARLGVQLTVASAARARKLYGEAVTQGPCAGRIPDRDQGSDCHRSALPGGGTLWTWQVAPSEVSNASATTPAVGQRSAMVVAADGGAVEVLEFAEQPNEGADIALPATGTLDAAALARLAERATQTWVATSRGSQGAVASAVPSGLPSAGRSAGPGITSLAFANPTQIAASNAAVYARLVAAAGGKAALLKGWPTWDSDPISAKTVFVGTQVQWPAGADSVYLQVVTSTKADAVTRYGAILTSGPCAVAANQGQGAPADCSETPLPGGAKAWTWDATGSVGGPSAATASSSPRGVLGRSVLVMAKDGSTLALTEFGQQGHGVGGGSQGGVLPSQPDRTALFTVATQLAQAWLAAAG